MMKRKKGISWQSLGEGAILLNPEKKTVHELNETASWIWSQLEDGASRESLANAMTAEFDVTAEQAQEDIAAFLLQAAELGIVEQEARAGE